MARTEIERVAKKAKKGVKPPKIPEPQRDLLIEVTRKATGQDDRSLPPVPMVGPNNYAAGTREALLDLVLSPKKQRKASQLDKIILQNGNASVPWVEIGRMTGLSAAEVRDRYLEIAREAYDLPPAEQMLIQVARLEGIINMLQAWAASGSEDHIKLLLEAIKQLREIHGLASNKTEIIIRVLVEEQANVIVKALQLVIAKIFDSYIVTNAKAFDEDGNPRQLVEVIDAIVVDALDEVQTLVGGAVDRQITAGLPDGR